MDANGNPAKNGIITVDLLLFAAANLYRMKVPADNKWYRVNGRSSFRICS